MNEEEKALVEKLADEAIATGEPAFGMVGGEELAVLSEAWVKEHPAPGGEEYGKPMLESANGTKVWVYRWPRGRFGMGSKVAIDE